MNQPPGGFGPPPGYGPSGYGPPPQNYGPQWPAPGGPPMMTSRPSTHPLAVVSLVLGLVMCIPGAGIAAVICGFLGKSAIAREPQRYEGAGLAIAGIVLGFLHVAVWMFYVIGILVFGLIGAAAGAS